MATAAASRPSSPVRLSPIPNYHSASLNRVKLSAGGSPVNLHKERKEVNVLAQRVPMGSGHWARRALAPPSPSVQQRQQRKRADGLRVRPSRLSGASMAGGTQ
uniref:Uncharacterized protein n=1 Tax=Hordeum vulgare subsp. vulgare TaxID=112509 RepID=A0A8I7BHQ2_HORVV